MKFRKKLDIANFEFIQIAPSSGENVQKFDIFANIEVEIFGNSKFPMLSFFYFNFISFPMI